MRQSRAGGCRHRQGLRRPRCTGLVSVFLEVAAPAGDNERVRAWRSVIGGLDVELLLELKGWPHVFLPSGAARPARATARACDSLSHSPAR